MMAKMSAQHFNILSSILGRSNARSNLHLYFISYIIYILFLNYQKIETSPLDKRPPWGLRVAEKRQI